MRLGERNRKWRVKNVLTLTDSTFDADVVKSEVPVLVDFWAALVRALPGDCAGGG